jgi:hypothetical protein
VSLGAPELFLTVSPVCGRRNDRSGSLLHFSGRGVECSGGKAGESVIGRGRNSADAWRGVSRCRRGSVRRTQRKCPLCEAGVGEHLGTAPELSGGTPAITRETRVLPLKRGAKRRVVQNISAIAAIFRCLTRARQTVRATSTGELEQRRSSVVARQLRARVARGQPTVTSVNLRWLPGPPPLGGRASVRHRARGSDRT